MKFTFNKILFLGNSITFHPGLEDSGWPGKDWGMAASAPEKDYVHLLLKRFADAASGYAPEFMIANIADFEREYDTYDVAAHFSVHAEFKPDLVILAIGENVPRLSSENAQKQYHDALSALVKLLSANDPPLFVFRSSFWPDPVKDGILLRVCEEAGGIYVDNGILSKDEANYARAERTFTHEGVGAHPGDKGMAAIAKTIWKAIENGQ